MRRRRKQSILEDLMEMPWWVSVVVAAIAYGGLRFVAPAVLAGSPITAMLGQAARGHAWMFGLFLLIPAPIQPSVDIAARNCSTRKRASGASAP